MDLITSIKTYIVSLIVDFSWLFMFLLDNALWIIVAGLLIFFVSILRPSIFNSFFKRELTRKELELFSTFIMVILVILPILWALLIFTEVGLTSVGMKFVAFGEAVNISDIFMIKFIISFIIIFFALYYLVTFSILQRKAAREMTEGLSKSIKALQKKGKIFFATLISLMIVFAIIIYVGFYSRQIYLEAMPQRPVEEVIIKTYGDIPGYLINSTVEVIEAEIGVAVSVEDHYSEVPFKDDFYNKERGQFSADGVWEVSEDFRGHFFFFGYPKRIIRIVDIDLYTEIQPERPYVFSRALPNVQNILISVYRLKNLSDEDENPAPKELVESRMRKVVLQSLSYSAALYSLPEEKEEDLREDCVTVLKTNLSSLDEGKEFFSEKIKERNFEKHFLTKKK